MNDTDDCIFYKIKNLQNITMNKIKEKFDKDFEKFKNFFITKHLFSLFVNMEIIF
jgi:hypothetical protein